MSAGLAAFLACSLPGSSGDKPLYNYLKRHAWANQQKRLIGVTYVALDACAPRTVIRDFTLAAASVPHDAFPKKYVRGLPPDKLPLILLSRLAVDRWFSSKGLGDTLISHASKVALRAADEVDAAASSRMRIVTGSAGMHVTTSLRWKAPWKADCSGCSWI